MPAILSFLATILAKFLGDNVLRFIAGKALLFFLFVTVIPLVLNNFLADILEMSFSLVSDSINPASFNPAVSLSGLAAWLSAQLRVSECLSVIVSSLIAKVTLRSIPFLRL